MSSSTLYVTDGASVVAADGSDLGRVERLVVDPRTNDVTHLVLAKGFFSADERIVPIEMVAQAVDGVVRLSDEVALDELRPFEETHFLPLAPPPQTQMSPSPSPFVWMYPTRGTVDVPTYTNHVGPQRATTITTRNIPDDAVVLEPGVDVVTLDAEKIGTVAAVSLDDEGDLVSIEVDRGWFKEDRTLPAHVISEIEPDAVRLALSAAVLEPWSSQN